jgi:hypothetical protein
MGLEFIDESKSSLCSHLKLLLTLGVLGKEFLGSRSSGGAAAALNSMRQAAQYQIRAATIDPGATAAGSILNLGICISLPGIHCRHNLHSRL